MDRLQGQRQVFDREDTAEILDLAGRLESDERSPDSGLTRQQLYRVADELDIRRDAIDKAIRDLSRSSSRSVKEQKRAVRRRMRFVRHAMAYLITVASLFLVDALDGGGWWFFYIAAIWGIFLALHALRFVTRRNGPLEQWMGA